jgi:maltooligosyltrehalose trehalohydrolase
LSEEVSLGAAYPVEGRCRFRVWAPLSQKVEVRIVSPRERVIPLETEGNGYYSATTDTAELGDRYFYRLDDEKERPDPDFSLKAFMDPLR